MADRAATKRADLQALGLRSPPGWQGPVGDECRLQESLRFLRTAWEQTRERAKSGTKRREIDQQLALIASCDRQLDETWSTGDNRVPDLTTQLLGERLWWWSGEVPQGRRVAIVSSRLPRRLDPQGTWLQGLRASLRHLREQEFTLVIGAGTAGAELILRGALRVGLKTVLLRCCTDLPEENWKAQWQAKSNLPPQKNLVECWALPEPLHAAVPAKDHASELRSIPERDRAVLGWADDVIVLGLRARGNLERLLRRRLATSPGTVLLTELSGLQPARLQKELIEAGAVPWFPREPGGTVSEAETTVGHAASAEQSANRVLPQVSKRTALSCLLSGGEWEYLTHTTRACDGPWPGQSRDEYLDELFDGDASADHSPLAALLRIVTQRRLHASGMAIRGKFPVVSWTAVPLGELAQLRVFRAHRTRWDFEPYGICIRRGWLEARGARAVNYEQEAAWKSLPEVDRPFFQLRHGKRQQAKSAADVPVVDWSVEQEWRHLGDLNLDQLSQDDAFVFVPSEEDAEVLSATSPWPVVVVESKLTRAVS